ncbi:unnamed protein product [Eruca vesicaria subsp. sativa]|uniref:NADH dehydrogenase subunit 4L n=1 Tax=Eruca vesicaria subsp. sativa TaxID=29727 RepID=A0ABC8JQH1_ERUVS|nr:unnamed protein product [Eruca vesicaria subsp. sativa]
MRTCDLFSLGTLGLEVGFPHHLLDLLGMFLLVSNLFSGTQFRTMPALMLVVNSSSETGKAISWQLSGFFDFMELFGLEAVVYCDV